MSYGVRTDRGTGVAVSMVADALECALVDATGLEHPLVEVPLTGARSPEADIAVQSRIILESITDEASMHALETIYAEKIAQGWMATSQSSDVYPGKLDREFDKWIFHPDRKPGDKTSVTTDVGIAILYYIGSSKDPEWYDRVNSFIRIDNFQEFIMAKQEEYPFRFNEEGLKDI